MVPCAFRAAQRKHIKKTQSPNPKMVLLKESLTCRIKKKNHTIPDTDVLNGIAYNPKTKLFL
jgi:glutamine cyclotransferase